MHWLKRILTIVALIGLLGGVILFLRRKTPEKRVETAVARILGASTFHLHLTTDIAMPERSAYGFERLTVDGEGDVRQQENGVVDADVVLILTAAAPGTILTGRGGVRTVDRQVFFKLDEIPILFSGLQRLRGQWFAFPRDTRPLPLFSRSALVSELKRRTLFREVRVVGREEVEGTETTHVRVRCSPEELSRLIEHMLSQSGQTLTEDAQRRLLERATAVSEVPFDLWIDGNDMLRKLTVDVPSEQHKEATHVAVVFSAVGREVDIQVPPHAQSISSQPTFPALPQGQGSVLSPSPP